LPDSKRPRRGETIGQRIDKPEPTEAEHYLRCPACGGWFDIRDLAQVIECSERRQSAEKAPARGGGRGCSIAWRPQGTSEHRWGLHHVDRSLRAARGAALFHR
jgi:hypothetical protein